MKDLIEHITWKGKPLTYIIRAEVDPSRTTFLTPPEFKRQVGYVVYPAGGADGFSMNLTR